MLTGCSTVEKAAVSTFRVVDAPANYVRQRIDSSHTATTTTTTSSCGHRMWSLLASRLSASRNAASWERAGRGDPFDAADCAHCRPRQPLLRANRRIAQRAKDRRQSLPLGRFRESRVTSIASIPKAGSSTSPATSPGDKAKDPVHKADIHRSLRLVPLERKLPMTKLARVRFVAP